MFGKSSSFYDYQIEKESAIRQQERRDARLVLAGRIKRTNDLLYLLNALGLTED